MAEFIPTPIIANSMYPACEILEYTNILLNEDCIKAERLPINNVIMAIPKKIGVQKSCKGKREKVNKRSRPAKDAILTTVLIKLVIKIGAPS
ncbi:hypothetical protein D3C87_1595020 [compost metagenome]